MAKKRFGQSAVEFLATYGWAVLIMLAFVAALYYFGAFSLGGVLPRQCEFQPGFSCESFKLMMNESGMQAAFFGYNGMGYDIGFGENATVLTAENLGMEGKHSYVGNCTPSVVAKGEPYSCIIDINTTERLPRPGDRAQVDIAVSYKNCETNPDYASTGNCSSGAEMNRTMTGFMRTQVEEYALFTPPTPPPIPVACGTCEYCESGFGDCAVCQPGHCLSTTCNSASTCGTPCDHCDGAGVCCIGGTPYCESDMCVACLLDTDCPVGTPFCLGGECIECLSNTDCSGGTPYCLDGDCVEYICNNNGTCDPSQGEDYINCPNDCPAPPPVCAPNWVVSDCGCTLDVPGTYTINPAGLTMNTGLSACITIPAVGSGLTLDCQDRTITGPGTSSSWRGVWLYDAGKEKVTDVTVQNCEISSFYHAIILYYADNNRIIGNNLTTSMYGIFVSYGNNNEITGNIANSNENTGILFYSGTDIGNVLTSNTACSNPVYNIGCISGSIDNQIDNGGNVCTSSNCGIACDACP